MLAWNYFHPNQPAPKVIDLIQDYDLWNFNHPETLAMNFGFKTEMQTVKEMENFDKLTADETYLNSIIATGKPLADNISATLYSLSRKDSKKVRVIQFGNHTVTFYQANDLISLAGHEVLKENSHFTDYSMSYFVSNTGEVIFSLRSRKKSGIHVGEIAKKYGGGGHEGAAGFKMQMEPGFAFLKALYQLPDLRPVEVAA